MIGNQIAVIDLDFVKYMAASLGEDRSILVTNKSNGEEFSFKTRTEFYGRNKAKNEGWLREFNKKADKPLTYEDFFIVDVQTPKPVEFSLQIAKTQVNNALESLGTDLYKAFLGKGDCWRVERSTLLKYKGQRESLLKPLHLDAVTEYLISKYRANVVTGWESDDACVAECYKQNDHVLIGAEKDFYGCPVRYFNASKPDEGVLDCDTFGRLYLNSKGQVKGYGRLFFYWQVGSGDSVDNYHANCFSNIKWADKSAYNALHNTRNDKQAFQALKEIYQHLYPTPKVVTGWRGDQIEIDWQYVLNENFDLSRMQRFENDIVIATDVLANFKV